VITPEFVNEQCAKLDAAVEAAKIELYRLEGARRQMGVLVAELMRQERELLRERADRIRMGIDGGPMQRAKLPVNEAVAQGLNGSAMNEQTDKLFVTS
jgi:hypothetical protein